MNLEKKKERREAEQVGKVGRIERRWQILIQMHKLIEYVPRRPTICSLKTWYKVLS